MMKQEEKQGEGKRNEERTREEMRRRCHRDSMWKSNMAEESPQR